MTPQELLSQIVTHGAELNFPRPLKKTKILLAIIFGENLQENTFDEKQNFLYKQLI